jgi:hypothetical protein
LDSCSSDAEQRSVSTTPHVCHEKGPQEVIP